MNQNVLAESNHKDTRIWKCKKPIKNIPVVFKILTHIEYFHFDEGFNSKCPYLNNLVMSQSTMQTPTRYNDSRFLCCYAASYG